jgi:hypothetical protein
MIWIWWVFLIFLSSLQSHVEHGIYVEFPIYLQCFLATGYVKNWVLNGVVGG